MKKENENMEATTQNNETAEVAETEVKESKVKNFISKSGKFIKKHGLKIALGTGAVIGTGFAVMKALRKSDEQAALDYLGESDFEDDDYVENSEVTAE